LPRITKPNRDVIATDDQLNDFYRRITKRNKHLMDYIMLAIETACRRGELITLKWANVEFNRKIAHLYDTKNGEARDVPLSPHALDILQNRRTLRQQGDYVFTSQVAKMRGDHIKPATISRAFRRVRDEIEKDTGVRLDLRLHDLRHTSATMWSKDVKNIFKLQKITGHKSIKSLARYVNHQSEDIAEDMAKIQKKKAKREAKAITGGATP
jgi:integrase